MNDLTFQQIIKMIKKRPMMLVGEKNIIYIFFYLNGFLSAKKCKDISLEEIDFKNNFQNWISNKYSSNINATWASTLLFYGNTHENAIELFNILYDEFKNRSKCPVQPS